jgi:hypothetical protein
MSKVKKCPRPRWGAYDAPQSPGRPIVGIGFVPSAFSIIILSTPSKIFWLRSCFRDSYYVTTSTVVCSWTGVTLWALVMAAFCFLSAFACWKAPFFGAASQTLMSLADSRVFLVGFGISCSCGHCCCVWSFRQVLNVFTGLWHFIVGSTLSWTQCRKAILQLSSCTNLQTSDMKAYLALIKKTEQFALN